VEQSPFEVTLQRLYASPRCHYFYLLVMVTTLFLVVVTVFKGFSVEENPLFVLTESVLNFVIIVDFVCRIRLVGLRRFFLGQQSPQTVGNLV